LFIRAVSPRTLSLAASPAIDRDRSPVASVTGLVKGWRVASSYLVAPRGPSRRCQHAGAHAARRERCLSPTSATDPTSRAPADCPIPVVARSLRVRLATVTARMPAHAWPKPTREVGTCPRVAE